VVTHQLQVERRTGNKVTEMPENLQKIMEMLGNYFLQHFEVWPIAGKITQCLFVHSKNEENDI